MSEPPTITPTTPEMQDMKQATGDTDLVCYCFGYSRKDIEDDFAKHGRSTIMETITVSKKAGTCDCAKRNPKGR
jgi:hypothetical protein